MKHILFITVFFLKFLKTFAFGYYSICEDTSLKGLTWLPGNKFQITLHGPTQNCYVDEAPDVDLCLQQGIQIIDHFKFYDTTNNEIYTV